MRCDYCNHADTAPNPVDTGQGGGSVSFDSNLGKHLCTACSNASDQAVKNEAMESLIVEEEWEEM